MKIDSFTILAEQPADALAIERLHEIAFGPGRFARAASLLREGVPHDDTLSFVARSGFDLVGSVRLTPIRIGGRPALLLGPLAVHPKRQNLGIGLELMRAGLARARAMGHRLVILVGDEPYYARVGFRKLPRNLLIMPGPCNPDRLLYLELEPGALAAARGLVLPPHRFAERSASFAVPHGAHGEQQRAEA